MSIQSFENVKVLSVPDTVHTIVQPFKIICSGPSLSGKSTLILQFLKHKNALFKHPFRLICLCVPENSMAAHSSFIESVKTLTQQDSLLQIQQGLPQLEPFSTRYPENTLFIIEDLATQLQQSSSWLQFFTHKSHHYNASVIFSTQSYFNKNRFSREIALNCTHLALLPSPADSLHFRTLSYRMFPEAQENVLKKAMNYCQHHAKDGLVYIFIDTHPRNRMPDGFFVKSFIFPEEIKNKSVFRPVYFLPTKYE